MLLRFNLALGGLLFISLFTVVPPCWIAIRAVTTQAAGFCVGTPIDFLMCWSYRCWLRPNRCWCLAIGRYVSVALLLCPHFRRKTLRRLRKRVLSHTRYRTRLDAAHTRRAIVLLKSLLRFRRRVFPLNPSLLNYCGLQPTKGKGSVDSSVALRCW